MSTLLERFTERIAYRQVIPCGHLIRAKLVHLIWSPTPNELNDVWQLTSEPLEPDRDHCCSALIRKDVLNTFSRVGAQSTASNTEITDLRLLTSQWAEPIVRGPERTGPPCS
jgi:hypothetical protein